MFLFFHFVGTFDTILIVNIFECLPPVLNKHEFTVTCGRLQTILRDAISVVHCFTRRSIYFALWQVAGQASSFLVSVFLNIPTFHQRILWKQLYTALVTRRGIDIRAWKILLLSALKVEDDALKSKRKRQGYNQC